jgi:hypothetical protein
LALWLAWYYLEVGDRQRANELITWAEDQADDEGNLPEQVFNPMLASVSHYDEWPIDAVLLRSHCSGPMLIHHRSQDLERLVTGDL